MRFYLGTHRPNWLGLTDVPLFVSLRTLGPMKRLPRALGTWALDSGGFSELSLYGEWRTTPTEYVAQVRRFVAEVGRLEWAAIQDWMCEPVMIDRTGLSIREHQRRTIASYLRLRDLAPELPWTPVIQGWTWGDYWSHAEAWEAAGVALASLPVVGIGSVCRRQATLRAAILIDGFAEQGLRLHGFGFKVAGLRTLYQKMASADSMAWSFRARRQQRGNDIGAVRNSQNSLSFALEWRADLLNQLRRRRAA